MEYFKELLVSGVLLVIFMVTIFKELRYFPSLWDRIPLLSNFIPSWSFFAPNPYQSDYHILFRTVSVDGEVGEWKQAYQHAALRRFYAFIWNPNKWFLKASVDIAIDLLKVSTAVQDKKRICLSLPYLSILNYVQALSRDPAAAKAQFVIMSQAIDGEPEVCFLSETHPLERGGACASG